MGKKLGKSKKKKRGVHLYRGISRYLGTLTQSRRDFSFSLCSNIIIIFSPRAMGLTTGLAEA